MATAVKRIVSECHPLAARDILVKKAGEKINKVEKKAATLRLKKRRQNRIQTKRVTVKKERPTNFSAKTDTPKSK